MKLRSLVLAQKLKVTSEQLRAKEELINQARDESEEVAVAIEEATTDEDFAALEAKIDELDKKIEELEQEKDKLEEEKESLEAQLEEETSKTEEVTQTNSKENNKNEEVTPTMNKNRFTEAQIETRNAMDKYIRSYGQVREAVEGEFKTIDGEALIPQEFLALQYVESDDLDLSKYVNTVKVKTGQGSYPVHTASNARLNTVAELAENPDLAKPQITNVDFKAETYRGEIAMSNEIIQDSAYDVVGLIEKDAAQQVLNTKNFAIANAMKGAAAKEATGLDGLKTVINTAIPKAYNGKIVMSSSLYNELDLLKDQNGRYLIQSDITKASGKVLFNKEVIVVDDTLLGDEGDKVAFYGDIKAAVTLFDRAQVTVKWDDHHVYGKRLMAATRFDVKATNAAAGVFINYTSEVAGA